MIDYIFAFLILFFIGFALWSTDPGNNFIKNIKGKIRK